jgi:hypothetical protein
VIQQRARMSYSGMGSYQLSGEQGFRFREAPSLGTRALRPSAFSL